MKPEDDYTHSVGAELNFNESMYFQFDDPEHGISGFVRLANRPNEGSGERTVCRYLPDGRVAFGFARPENVTNERMSGADMEFTVREPMARLRAKFDGQVSLLDDPKILVDPRQLAEIPTVACTAELAFEALGQPHEQNFDGDGPAFAPNHYEQLMAVTGTITVDGKGFDVQGHGLRDHSWGPRSWQAPWFYRWLHGTSPEFGFMAAYFGSESGSATVGGFVWDGTDMHQCSNIRLTTERDEDRVPQQVHLELVTDHGGCWKLTGHVGVTVPLRHRKRDATGVDQLTRILESRVRWTGDDGIELFGMSEYLDQIVDGVPVGLDV
ncbi:DUF7065 domain-containing protein [Nocardia vaccinii]|uniref:DUF7065 domain-containing protein n=1 Tax=Nocardia vaccinii TaxID=1822 RepID=UPI000AB84AE2|nr:hypothetical protein [Nocardia vaccinii]